MPRSRPASRRRGLRLDGGRIVDVEPQVRGDRDLGGSRPMSAQRSCSTSTRRRSCSGEPPGKFQCCAKRATDRSVRSLAGPADADRRVRLLDRLRLAAGVVQLVVLPVEGRRSLVSRPDDDLERLVEAVEPLLQRGQVDAVGVALLLVPAGADPELEPAVRDDVERGGHVRQHRRVAVGVAGHEHADPQPLRGLGQRRRGDPALEARAGRVREDRIEVVERPADSKRSMSSAACQTASMSAHVVCCGAVLIAKRIPQVWSSIGAGLVPGSVP